MNFLESKKKYFKRLYAKYILKKGLINAGNNNERLKEDLEKIIKKLEQSKIKID